MATCGEWETMENNGAVFLPLAGNRQGVFVTSVGYGSYYWSASISEVGLSVALFMDYAFGAFAAEPDYRFNGCCVRLVQDVEP